LVGQSMTEEELRRLARERIERHELPYEEPAQIWGGHGTGHPCALCRSPIGPTECEYELEQQLDGALQVFHFHVECESIWQLECTADLRMHAQDMASSTPGPHHPDADRRLKSRAGYD
jgi:hypothetical protein